MNSCNNSRNNNVEKATQEILQLESDQKTYHVTKNAKSFTDLFSDHFVSVQKGSVDSPARKESFDRFDNYFKKAEFIRWADTNQPIIRFSDDGSVAYVIVQKEVIVKSLTSNGSRVADTTDFAWLTIYKKYKTGWKIDCVVSTNR
jgi:hypothetical protein